LVTPLSLYRLILQLLANAMLDEEVFHLLVIRLAMHHQAEHGQRPEVDRNPPPAFDFN
jgi:hypothetical protein